MALTPDALLEALREELIDLRVRQSVMQDKGGSSLDLADVRLRIESLKAKIVNLSR